MSAVAVFSVIFSIILVYYAALTIWYTVLLLAAFPEVLRKCWEATYGNVMEYINKDKIIPLTIITPAFNEAKRILNSVYSVINSEYKNINLIIVNDGSTDNTMDLLIKEFDMHPVPMVIRETIKTEKIKKCYQSRKYKWMMLLDKEHSPYNCAADAVNAGLNASRSPITLTLDADTVLEPQALTYLMFTILTKSHTLIVGGSVYVLNGLKVSKGAIKEVRISNNFIEAVQSTEYLRSFLYSRAGLNYFGGALSYSGAFTLFETQVLREVGGFDTENYAYDTEIVVKIHYYMNKNKYPYLVRYSPDAFAWTEVPSTLKAYWNQRVKWQRGMWRSCMKYKSMIFNPRYGIIGLLGMPCYILFEIMGPVVEFISYLMFGVSLFFGIFSPYVFMWFILMATGFIALITIAMFFLNEISFNRYSKVSDSFKMVIVVLLEMLGFRQFRALCCSYATIQYFFNRLRGKPV